MSSQFSNNGHYFALLTNEGKLKIWNAINGSFEQEYSPDHHLACPCTCFQFLCSQSPSSKGSSPKKKKKRESTEATVPYIVLGTTTGVLLGYSIASASISFTISSKLNQEITCLSWIGGNMLYSGSNRTILQWDLEKHVLRDKWQSGNEKITAIREIQKNRLLTASKNITLWDIKAKSVLRNFTGHSSDVCLLEYVSPKADADAYIISGSKNDRLLNCWTLNENNPEKNAIASFLMDEVAHNISVTIGSDYTTNMVALTRNGLVHVYQHMLNGKCNKPLKPKTTIQVASDTGQDVVPIPIMGVLLQQDLSVLICHGSTILLTFENVTVNIHEKIQCLVRSDPKTLKAANQAESSKFRTPLVNNNVQYLTPHTSTSSAVKRKPDGSQEIPMEQRLENLTLTKSDINSKVPKIDNVAQLLVQGLHSKDKNILKSVLIRRDESIIRNTIKRLPMPVIVPLLEELTNYIQGKTAMSYTGSLWLKHLLQIHAALLLSNPQLSVLLDPVLGSIQSRLLLQTPLNSLKGRLDLLMSQINASKPQESNENDEALLVYVDKDTSDSEEENIGFMDAQSESDNEWTEESEEESEKENVKEKKMVNSEHSEEDSEMSS